MTVAGGMCLTIVLDGGKGTPFFCTERFVASLENRHKVYRIASMLLLQLSSCVR